MVTIYDSLINQYEFEIHIFFQLAFIWLMKKTKEAMKIVLFPNLNINQNLADSDINDIDVGSQLEQQLQIQETKESGWNFDETK